MPDAATTEHYEYLPAGVDYDCCGECNRVYDAYVPWPCPSAERDQARVELQAARDEAARLWWAVHQRDQARTDLAAARRTLDEIPDAIRAHLDRLYTTDPADEQHAAAFDAGAVAMLRFVEQFIAASSSDTETRDEKEPT